MANINSNDYYYYLHKTLISSPETIESLFNEGLKSRYHYSINSTLARVNEEDLKNNGLENEIMGYLGQGNQYNAVVIVKIPKRYFRDVIHRDGKMDPAVPLFREYSEEGWDWNSLFTPKLIQGVYCRDINKSFTNPNFSPVFDPSGCQYSDEQLDCFWSSNSSDWVNFANARRNSSFEQLYTRDKTSKTWDSLISHYSQLYDVLPIQMIRYEMPDGDKQLFGGITL